MQWICRHSICSAVKPAQNSAHDLPSGIGELAQFLSWQSQYFSHSGDMTPLELPAAPACAVVPALPLGFEPALPLGFEPALPSAFEPPLELPALVALEPALLEPGLPALPPVSESPESPSLQPNATHQSTAPATKTDDLMGLSIHALRSGSLGTLLDRSQIRAPRVDELGSPTLVGAPQRIGQHCRVDCHGWTPEPAE
jgi:hypothetical protein